MVFESSSEFDDTGKRPTSSAHFRTGYPTTAASVGLFLTRLPLGAYFLIAGIAKLRGGVPTFVEQHLSIGTKFMSENMARMFLQGLPWAEAALGALLVVGLLTRVASFLASALLVSFIIAVTGIKSPPLPFHPNLVFLGTALGLVFCGAGRLSLDGVLFGPRRTVTVTERYTDPLA